MFPVKNWCSSATSLTAITFTVFLKWLNKLKHSRLKSSRLTCHWKNVLARIDICLLTLILLTHDTLISKFCFICERHDGQRERERGGKWLPAQCCGSYRKIPLLLDRKPCGRCPALCQRYGYRIRLTARREHWQRVMLQKHTACFSQNFQQRRPGLCLPVIVFLFREGNLFTVISCENVDRNYVHLESVTKYCDTT